MVKLNIVTSAADSKSISARSRVGSTLGAALWFSVTGAIAATSIAGIIVEPGKKQDHFKSWLPFMASSNYLFYSGYPS